MMFSKKLALSLCSSLFLFFSYSYSASGSLLTDPDGLNITLFNDGFASNAFGPDGFTIGYNTSDMNPIPGNMPDQTLMSVAFFDNSISFEQFVSIQLSVLTAGWTMTIDDIDWPDGEEIVSADISFSNYPIALSVGFTASSLTIRYDGGETLDPQFPSSGGTGPLWEGTVTFDTAPVEVPVPAVLSLLLLGCLGVCLRRKVH
jgi:hypothetical protein